MPIIIKITENRRRCRGAGTSCSTRTGRTCSTCGSASTCCCRSGCSCCRRRCRHRRCCCRCCGLINTRSIKKNDSSYLFKKFVNLEYII